jgi:5-methylcytosine-specific restriction protein B
MFDSQDIKLAQNLLQAILSRNPQDALEKSRVLLGEIFGRRFSDGIENNGILRYRSLIGQEENIQYWGLLYEGAPASGVYENFSLVAFPDNTDNPNHLLLCFGIGTGGVTDDASLLGIPGVKRSISSLLKGIKKENWLVSGTRTFVKDELADDTTGIPQEVVLELGSFSSYDSLWRRYGKHLSSVCVIEKSDKGAMAFLSHILLYGHFRDWSFRKKYAEIVENELFPKLVDEWREYPEINWLISYLKERKFIIFQGPPGTGKTFLAERIARELKSQGIIEDYEIVQFHSSVTYEDFIEGIRPDTETDKLVFKKNIGPFIRCVEKARKSEKGFLLVIDEINRGDLAKILGEAIFLLEPWQKRTITLRSGKELEMPDNFYLVGTMNTADRSIAILDFAIRRRFAFVDFWPSTKQLQQIYDNSNPTVKQKALEYYNRIQNIFFKNATEEDLYLQPGHTYFFAKSIDALKAKMKYEVVPLLREYLAVGKLSFAKNELQVVIEEFEEA